MIIGLNVSHDPSAVLVYEGEVLFACEEEKLRREKSFHGFPRLALQHCLEIVKSKNENVTTITVAIGCSNLREFLPSHYSLRNFFGGLYKNSPRMYLLDLIKLFTNIDSSKYAQSVKVHFEYRLAEEIKRKFEQDIVVEIEYVDHHLSHALSALGGSPFTGGFVFTLDGKGDKRSGSSYRFEGEALELIEELSQFQSIGQMYSVVTEVLGFKSKRHEGKVTGLAARGSPEKFIEVLRKEFGHRTSIRQDSRFYLEQKRWNRARFLKYYLKDFNSSTLSIYWLTSAIKDIAKFCLLTNHAQRFQLGRMFYIQRLKKLAEGFEIERENLASAIQHYCEELSLDFISRAIVLHKNPGSVNVCLAGGVFSNVLLNQKVFELDVVRDVYVHPAMNDAGTAMGAAMQACMSRNIAWKRANNSIYLGPDSTFESKYEVGHKFTILSDSIGDKEIKLICDSLFDDKIVGICHGRLEWGPRALGNRSILARPDSAKITRLLNDRLSRSDFMPFAPMVLDEDIIRVFKGKLSPNKIAGNLMTMTFSLQESASLKLKAISHVDGTARPQIIRQHENPLYYELLRGIKIRIGYGVCINTSFNMHEHPIIQDSRDAFEMLESGAIDLLVVNHRLFRRRSSAMAD